MTSICPFRHFMKWSCSSELCSIINAVRISEVVQAESARLEGVTGTRLLQLQDVEPEDHLPEGAEGHLQGARKGSQSVDEKVSSGAAARGLRAPTSIRGLQTEAPGALRELLLLLHTSPASVRSSWPPLWSRASAGAWSRRCSSRPLTTQMFADRDAPDARR